LNLGDKSLKCLSCNWGIDNAINANFSPDGSMITFMGSIHGLQTWDVWTYKFGSGAPTNLTHQRMLVNEDPKFAPSGAKIVFKERHWDNTINRFVHQLKVMDLTGNVINTVTDGSVETSMPYYTTDEAKIIYAAGAGASSAIHVINVDRSGDTALLALPGIQEYYPVVRDSTSFLFTRWVSTSNVNDQVYLSDFTGNATALPFDGPNDNYSDAFPVGQRYVAMSSTRPGGKGGYDVYLADITSGTVTSLDQLNPSVNTANDELGSAYTPY
jgi:Tol biopolymer transport system component